MAFANETIDGLYAATKYHQSQSHRIRLEALRHGSWTGSYP
jgi:hypothetical protein